MRRSIFVVVAGVALVSLVLIAATRKTAPPVSSAPLLSGYLNSQNTGQTLQPATAAPATVSAALGVGNPRFTRADAAKYALSLPYAIGAQTVSVHYRLWNTNGTLFSKQSQTEDPAFASMLATKKAVVDLPVWIVQYYNTTAAQPTSVAQPHMTVFVYLDAYDGVPLGILTTSDNAASE